MRSPLTMDDYLGARMISSPLGLFDCDVPIDEACAIIVSAADAAKDCARAPLTLEAMGSALGSQETWDQRADLPTMGAPAACADLGSPPAWKPTDPHALALYDAFRISLPY